MKTNFLPQPILMEKAIDALIDKLGVSKASEFWTSLGYGKKDYTKLRKKIFSGETIESLYRKIEQIEKK
ncbi:MAG: hypothetical protein ISS87_01385 [Candidatus Pacebacteria bacterium]|nr:hypothetical protein [Candidatus Paceibacterota bacterium]